MGSRVCANERKIEVKKREAIHQRGSRRGSETCVARPTTNWSSPSPAPQPLSEFLFVWSAVVSRMGSREHSRLGSHPRAIVAGPTLTASWVVGFFPQPPSWRCEHASKAFFRALFTNVMFRPPFDSPVKAKVCPAFDVVKRNFRRHVHPRACTRANRVGADCGTRWADIFRSSSICLGRGYIQLKIRGRSNKMLKTGTNLLG